MKRNIPDLLWIGRGSTIGGYKSATDNYLSALKYVNIPYKFKSVEDLIQEDHLEKTVVAEGKHQLVSVIHEFNPEFYGKFQKRGNTRLIGCTVFETHSIPPAWVELFTKVDQVWVPTKFNYDTYSQAGIPEEKIRIVPHCLDFNKYNDSVIPLHIIGKRKFSFLYVFKVPCRKDYGLLLRAYFDAFTSKDDVCLIIKTSFRWDLDMNTIKNSVKPKYNFDDPGLPKVIIINEIFTESQMLSLYKACDVYATTERAKGWDIPAMEAMAFGKPVVSIDWSGSTEFLNDSNGFLIPHTGRLVSFPLDMVVNNKLYEGQKWVEVREKDVSDTLRRVYENKDLSLKIGAQGRKDVQQKYSLGEIGGLIKNLLEQDYTENIDSTISPSLVWGMP